MVTYVVSVEGFDWDSDHFQRNTYDKQFPNIHGAKEYHKWLNSLKPDGDMHRKPAKYFHGGDEDDKLAEALDRWHGAIFTGTAIIQKVTVKRIY